MSPPSRHQDDDLRRLPGAELLHDRYRLDGKLGSGGMADVYLADDLRLGRQVAVKVLRAELATDDAFVERFRTEARAVAMLNHPNVVALHDRGQVGGRYYLVMEYVRGETLKQRLRRDGALPPAEAAVIAHALLAALQAAHERHIVHRDVTAQNVLLAADGRVKVADFGIARIGASALTRTGTMLGTCHYVSPEQARGMRADARSDLYGAGVVLFEMVTGRVPFEGDSDVAVALQHVNDPPPRPRDLAPAVPEALERVVLRALAKDPADRYQSAAEFAAALDAALAAPAVTGEVPAVPPAAPDIAAAPEAATVLTGSAPAPTVVMPETAATVVRPRRRRWPWLLAAALALVAIAAGGAVYLFAAAAAVAVPDVVGRSEAQARAAIRGADLRAVTHREYVDGIDAGVVARQRPGPGVAVDERSRVHLWISRGPLHVPAPDLRGLDAAEAHDLLVEAGLDPSRRNGRSDDVGEGEVYQQHPAAGESLARGDTVAYWVSTGLPRTEVPDVVGLSSGDAGAELQAAGLTVSVDLTYGWGEYPDTVVEQDPAAGTIVEQGAEVTISVAVF
jgi:serine/threonine-protein kinase